MFEKTQAFDGTGPEASPYYETGVVHEWGLLIYGRQVRQAVGYPYQCNDYFGSYVCPIGFPFFRDTSSTDALLQNIPVTRPDRVFSRFIPLVQEIDDAPPT